MFDVSWTDPTTETVGQRKNRKNLESRGLPRRPSIHSTSSSEAPSVQTIPSFLNVFGGKKQALSRTRSNSKVSSHTEDFIEASTGALNYTARSEGSGHKLSSTIAELPANGYFTGGPRQSDAEQCSLSDGMFQLLD
jgi:hypothetical protein